MKEEIKSGYAKQTNLDFIIKGIREICKIEMEQIEPIKLLSKKIIYAIKRKEIIVIIKNNCPIGFIWATFTKKIPYGVNFSDEEKTYCWVNWSYISKSERKKGLGHILYRLLEEECKKHNIYEIRGDIFTVNKKSLKFHQKLGYKPPLTIYRKYLNKNHK